MPQVNIPDTLFSEIEKAVRLPISPEDFVVAAVREKLSGSRGERSSFGIPMKPEPQCSRKDSAKAISWAILQVFAKR